MNLVLGKSVSTAATSPKPISLTMYHFVSYDFPFLNSLISCWSSLYCSCLEFTYPDLNLFCSFWGFLSGSYLRAIPRDLRGRYSSSDDWDVLFSNSCFLSFRIFKSSIRCSLLFLRNWLKMNLTLCWSPARYQKPFKTWTMHFKFINGLGDNT